jgi:hypothetical protein
MFEFIVFGALMLVLVGALGLLPYSESTYDRWNRR